MERTHGNIQWSYMEHPERGKRLIIRVGVNEITFYRYYFRHTFAWGQCNQKTAKWLMVPDWAGWIDFWQCSIQLDLFFWRC